MFPNIPPAGRVQRNQPSFPMIDVVAAAIMAYHQNGDTLVKADLPADEGSADGTIQPTPAQVANKTIMSRLLQKGGVNDEARAEAEEEKAALQSNMTFNLLTSKTISVFMKDVLRSFDSDEILISELGKMAYVPSLYANLKERERRLEEEIGCRISSVPLGNVGAKVTVNFTKINHHFVEQFNCFSVFGKDDCGNLVRFFTGNADLLSSGKISGKVKQFGADAYHGNAIVTSLNYVKAA